MMSPVTRIAALGLVAVIAACGGEISDPEAEVRAWLEAMQEHAENKERRDMVANISPAYSDARGNSRDDVENILRVYFLRQHRIALGSTIDEITIIDNTIAEVSMTVGGVGTQSGGLGINADAYNFELELEHDGDEWRLISARWGEIGSQLR